MNDDHNNSGGYGADDSAIFTSARSFEGGQGHQAVPVDDPYDMGPTPPPGTAPSFPHGSAPSVSIGSPGQGGVSQHPTPLPGQLPAVPPAGQQVFGAPQGHAPTAGQQGPPGQFNASPTGQFVAPPTGQFNAPPSGQFVAPPTGQFNAPPSGQFAAPPTGQFPSGPTGQFGAVQGGPVQPPNPQGHGFQGGEPVITTRMRGIYGGGGFVAGALAGLLLGIMNSALEGVSLSGGFGVTLQISGWFAILFGVTCALKPERVENMLKAWEILD